MLSALRKFCQNNNGNIKLYGAGLYGRKTGGWLDENGFEWNGYIETSHDSHTVLDKPVARFLDSVNDGRAVIVCVGEKYREEIISILDNHGINNRHILSRSEIETIDKENKYDRLYSTNKNVMVLLYHRVISLESDPQLLAVSPENFEDHIRYIKENFKVLRFEDNFEDVDEKSVVITFDDGYADNYLYALPILEKYAVPATVFVSTGNIDADNEMWWDELETIFLLHNNLPCKVVLLGEELDLSSEEYRYQSYITAHKMLKAVDYRTRNNELKRLVDSLAIQEYPRKSHRLLSTDELKRLSESDLITIGGHTVTHSSLAMENSDMQKWEIQESKRVIESIIGKEINTFSYPFGGQQDYLEETCRLTKEAGFTKAAIVREGLSYREDSMKITRNLIRNWARNEFARNIGRLWCIYG